MINAKVASNCNIVDIFLIISQNFGMLFSQSAVGQKNGTVFVLGWQSFVSTTTLFVIQKL